MNRTEAEQYIAILEQMRASRHGWESDRFGEEDETGSQNGAVSPSGETFTPRHPDYIDGDGKPQVWPNRMIVHY